MGQKSLGLTDPWNVCGENRWLAVENQRATRLDAFNETVTPRACRLPWKGSMVSG